MSGEGDVREWSEISAELLDEPAVRRLYAGRGPHRVSCREYPAGAAPGGRMRSGTCFVLAGSCRYEFDDRSIELHSGQFAELPAGQYGFVVLGAAPVRLVMVWKLPDSIPG